MGILSERGRIVVAQSDLSRQAVIQCHLPLPDEPDGPLHDPILAHRGLRVTNRGVVRIDGQAFTRREYLLIARLYELKAERQVRYQLVGQVVLEIAQVVEGMPLNATPIFRNLSGVDRVRPARIPGQEAAVLFPNPLPAPRQPGGAIGARRRTRPGGPGAAVSVALVVDR